MGGRRHSTDFSHPITLAPHLIKPSLWLTSYTISQSAPCTCDNTSMLIGTTPNQAAISTIHLHSSPPLRATHNQWAISIMSWYWHHTSDFNHPPVLIHSVLHTINKWFQPSTHSMLISATASDFNHVSVLAPHPISQRIQPSTYDGATRNQNNSCWLLEWQIMS